MVSYCWWVVAFLFAGTGELILEGPWDRGAGGGGRTRSDR